MPKILDVNVRNLVAGATSFCEPPITPINLMSSVQRCLSSVHHTASGCLNPLTPNDHYSCRTAPLTSKRCILYIYSTNIDTEYFKHGIYSPFFLSTKCSLFHNSNVFGSCFIHILYTGCAKISKNNSGAKRLICRMHRSGNNGESTHASTAVAAAVTSL